MISKGQSLLVVGMVFGLMASANAATTRSRSLKYFNETGNVVGQSILYCNNAAFHGGNVHTAYYIIEEINCAPLDLNRHDLPVHVIVPGTQISGYTLPGGQTISAACGLAQCIGEGEMPDEMISVNWEWITGVN